MELSRWGQRFTNMGDRSHAFAIGWAALVVLAVGCGEPSTGASSSSGSGSAQNAVAALAKVDGWRAGLDDYYARLEIAYDRETAEQAWRDSVPEGLEERRGDPREPGLYGDFESVDFESHAVAVWSAGQSGWCPGWLKDVRTNGRKMRITTDEDGDSCTDDYNAYTMVVAIDSDRLPAQDTLPLKAVMNGYAGGTGGPPTAVVDVYQSKKVGSPADGK